MALKSTIFKLDLQISDMDRGYYGNHSLTIARHPSETDERMMMRVLAFAMFADEGLVFCKGLSSDDEPDLWQKDLTDAIQTWIEVGLPDERGLRQASGRSDQVVLLAYGGRTVDIWWQKNRAACMKLQALKVYRVPEDVAEALTAMAVRTMQIQCSVQDGEFWFSDGERSAHFRPLLLD
ncbi:YaeQ family protein [Niveibacterium sp. 24ML]|uniref:YaeQ family protein n=1 Tax=Niveibacterium sp. 24ML TaxID=2985512 RepID=UPI00226E8090|nr:YaeQ family protein [Niveibacterium sp. 24ML]MCX9158369.1 YaeQ family protein [Niveibacterium sp. 24ML]